ncbi:hypothetical protein K1719_009574 [Acacia pycnantha]|nr:hypothetical protein K1719_009574 [Acacia pycnantha]
MIDHKGVKSRCWSFCFKKILKSKCKQDKEGQWREGFRTSKKVMSCLDARENDKGDVVVTIGDRYDAREQTKETEVRNLGKSVELASQYYKDGADEISFLNITVSGTSLLETCLCCRYCNIQERITWGAWLFKMQLTLPGYVGCHHVYFVHSYRAMPSTLILSSSDYFSCWVRNLVKPVELARKYYKDGADELSRHYWFRGLPLGNLPMLQLLVELEILQILMAGTILVWKRVSSKNWSNNWEEQLRTKISRVYSNRGSEYTYISLFAMALYAGFRRRRVAIIEEAELARGW